MDKKEEVIKLLAGMTTNEARNLLNKILLELDLISIVKEPS